MHDAQLYLKVIEMYLIFNLKLKIVHCNLSEERNLRIYAPEIREKIYRICFF